MNPQKWQKIDEIFHSALEIEASERLKFIETESNGDKEIFSEVKKLVSAHEEANSFIKNPAAKNALKALADEKNASEVHRKNLSIGAKIGRFEIIKQIGSGGMGEVYLAKDQKLCDGQEKQETNLSVLL